MNGRSKIRKPKPASPPPPPANAKTLISIMARKSSILKQTLATFLVALIIYGLFSAFLNPTETSKLDSSFPLSSANSGSVVLNEVTSPQNFLSIGRVKVYMYDLPKRFTYGVIQQHSLARGFRPVDDLLGLKYPGHQHMAEWYLFKDLMKPDSERVGSPIVRVMDPEEADLFYVPFFSSLSLIVNPIRPATETTERPVYSDEENQEALVEWLEKQEYWKRNNGRDHVIIAQDPNALCRVIDRVKNSVLLVSDFGRLRPEQASLAKDIILPYSHRINTYTGGVGTENRATLLFFMGNRYRKEVMS